MSLFLPGQVREARLLAKLAHSNPFRTDRIDLERELLGDAFTPLSQVWSHRIEQVADNANVIALGNLAQGLIDQARERLSKGKGPANEEELLLYDRAVSYHLFHTHRDDFKGLLTREDESEERGPRRVRFFERFVETIQHYLGQFGLESELTRDPAHVFAICFQIRRAFHHIHHCIIGGSLASAELRARIWESIFTHDMGRYRRCLYDRMGDLPTLVTGPTGTGKELVAQAVGLSRYVPFAPEKRAFAADYVNCLRALNLSALSPMLIESELFGHRRGAFTGALDDKTGWLESCGAFDTVFLDEIGDLDPAIQVKLLRVLQDRLFQRLGDTVNRRFEGKIIAATNRDLPERIASGQFRTDFYYRLCADQIVTVSLAEQLQGSGDELQHFVRFIAHRLVGEEECNQLTREAMAWIEGKLGYSYAWPGNVRELEQCIRNIMIHNDYQAPPRLGKESGALRSALDQGELTADELLRWYCTTVYRKTGSYQETARLLQLDRRTVKAKIDEAMVERYG